MVVSAVAFSFVCVFRDRERTRAVQDRKRALVVFCLQTQTLAMNHVNYLYCYVTRVNIFLLCIVSKSTETLFGNWPSPQVPRRRQSSLPTHARGSVVENTTSPLLDRLTTFVRDFLARLLLLPRRIWAHLILRCSKKKITVSQYSNAIKKKKLTRNRQKQLLFRC